MQDYQPGDAINHRYPVIRCLGKGAMGTVYLVEDALKVNRKVALKVLDSDNLDDPDLWSKGEYEALTRLRHPNLARVYDFGRIHETDDFYIVSEFIRGEDLYTATREMPLDEFLEVVTQICRALDFIHMQGYVHFDVKPDNILVTRDKIVGTDEGSKVQWSPDMQATSSCGQGPPRAKLIDFGLAERITGSFDFAIKGTFNFVAPEIIRGQTPDKRADLYSLGVTLYKVFTGRIPFIGEDGRVYSREETNWQEEIRRALTEQPPYMADILVRLLDDDPDKRFLTAREIIQSINAGAGRRYQLETEETKLSYLYSSRLVGRQKELNRLKDEAERVFRRMVLADASETNDGDDAPEQAPDAADDASSDEIDESAAVDRLLRKEPVKSAPMFLISGEIGIGKSRLFEEFTHFLKMRETPVHTGNCYETSQDAYQPFRELISQIAISIGVESEVFTTYKSTLLKLCPSLRTAEDEAMDNATGFRPDKERLFFIDQIAQFIIQSAATHPCIIAINNIHWADDASIELLAYLVEEMAQAETESEDGLALMFVASMRSDENISPRLQSLLARMREDGRIRDIPLRRFSRTQVAELIHNMLQFEEIPTPFLNRLEERTSGNPLFIAETLKTLQEEGIITRDGEQWKIRSADLSRIDIPHGVEAILLRRVHMLEILPQRILEALAVYDKPMSGRLLKRLQGFSGQNVMSNLRELGNRGMVTKSLDGGRVYFSITQSKLREIVYENIEAGARATLHGNLADALVEEYAGKEEEMIEDLAYHYQRSDRVEKALELTVRCGDTMRSIFAHEKATEYYRLVIEQTKGVPEYRDIWLATHEKLGDIGTISGDYEMAEQSYTMLLHEGVVETLTRGGHARVLRKIGKLDEIQGEYDRSLRYYKQARELLEGEDDAEHRDEKVKIYNSIAWVYVCMGKYEKAMTIAVDALRTVEGLHGRIEHALIFSTIGCANYYKGNLDQAIEYHSRALEICENLENIPEIIVSLNRLGEAYLGCSEHVEAIKHYNQALTTSEEIGDAFGRAVALHNLADAHLCLGEDEKAQILMAESLELSRHYRMRFLNTKNYMLSGKLRMRSDDLAKAEGDLFRALGVFAKQGNRWGVSHCLLEISSIYQRRQNHQEALRLVGEATENANAINVASLKARARLIEVRSLRALGKERGEMLLDRLERAADLLEGSKDVEVMAAIDMERGETLVSLRDPEGAQRAYEKANERYREIADRLPSAQRTSYLELREVVGPEGEPPTEYREVPAPVESGTNFEDPGSGFRKKDEEPAAPAPAALDVEQEELLRVATLLQEMGEMGSSPVFLEKVFTCLVRGSGSSHGFLLTRSQESLKINVAVDPQGRTIRNGAGYLCIEALSSIFQNGEPIIAPAVMDDPKIAGYESLYRTNSKSLAILPLKFEGSTRGAIYLNNPAPERLHVPNGGPLLAAYQNLIQLIIPRPLVAQQ